MLMSISDIGTTAVGTGLGWLLPALLVLCLAVIAVLAVVIVRQRRLIARKNDYIVRYFGQYLSLKYKEFPELCKWYSGPELTQMELIKVMHLLKKMLYGCVLLLPTLPAVAQERTDTTYVFRFVPTDDMFYVPFGGNEAELERLENCVERYYDEIRAGFMPLRVDGYSCSESDRQTNLQTAKLRSNRIKSELITRQGLTEDCFITKNYSGSGDYVTVRIAIPAGKDEAEEARLAAERAEQERAAAEQAERQRIEQQKQEQERIAREKEQACIAEEQARLAAEQAKADSLAQTQVGAERLAVGKEKGQRRGWYAGVSAGMPFGTSAMGSFGADRTTPGWSAGIYGGYRFNPVLSLELQAAWGQTFLNYRDCCPDYWMGADGNRYEAAVAGMDGWNYSALQSRTFVQRYAAQVNVNLLGFFRATRDSRWSLDLSPHIAAIGTESDFRLTDSKAEVLQGSLQWHFGAGGNIQAGYTFPVGLQLGIYTGMTWLSGKPMDGTPEHLHKANYIWETGLRFGWSFGAKGKEDRR